MLVPLRYLLLPQQGAQRGATHHRDQRGAGATRRVSQGAAGGWDEVAAAVPWCGATSDGPSSRSGQPRLRARCRVRG